MKIKSNNKVFKIIKDFKNVNKKCLKYLTDEKYQSFIMKTIPITPKGGQAFLYQAEHDSMNFPDQYLWKLAETYLSNDGIEKKRYYINLGQSGKSYDTRFTRIIYYLSKIRPEERVYLIVYKGDESIGESRMNLKTGKPHIATHKKILSALRGTTKNTPQNIYAETLSKANLEMKEKGVESKDEYQRCYFPKNPEQIKNKLKYERSKERISKDFIFNVYELSLTLKDYIIQMKLIPEIQIIFSKFLL